MESNGKSVRTDGSPVGRATSAITWGGVGTDAQHAVFQLLHQGHASRAGRIRRLGGARAPARLRASSAAPHQLLRPRRGFDGGKQRRIRPVPIPATGPPPRS
jgi:hypothetical protein